MSDPGLDAKVAFLSRPESYPERPRQVERIETHMSWVFLTDRHAYKLKKPIRYDGLDFTTLARRRHDCEEEIRLNRRLTTGVYLGALRLVRTAGGALALDAPGETVDWLVWMRRLPAERMLDARIASGGLERCDVEPAARRLAHFYARCEPAERDPAAYLARLAAGTRSDREELTRPEYGLPEAAVHALAKAQLAFLEAHAALFEERVRAGRIVEGHGDLRPEHICLVDPPAIIDCLEFSRELRIVDPADELAFLGLECERLGNPAVGAWFLDPYREITGDDPPAALLRFHRLYRALRRAKIAAWHLREADVRDPERWRERARRYLALAVQGS